MNKKAFFKIARPVLQIAVAVIGMWWVVSKLSWNDHVLAILPGQTVPTPNVVLVGQQSTDFDTFYKVIDPRTGKILTLDRNHVINEPDHPNLTVYGDGHQYYVLGEDLTPDLKRALRLLVAPRKDSTTAFWAPTSQFPDFQITVPHPRVQIGVLRMVRNARMIYILLALAIFPLTILITSFRWHELLKALDIRLPLTRTFVLNMVGLFWNTIIPTGSTGGDFLKAYYVAKQTRHRTRAVMSVVVDRAVGLLALIILGGVMAALQSQIPRCRQVAIASAAIVGLLTIALVIFYVPFLRQITGLDFILSRLPMQKQVRNAIETMQIYGNRPALAAAALVVSFPVHMVVITAAQLCGIAFGLHLSLFYYWMAVPVIVLAAAIPISPQGAGVMEYFAIKLLEPQGVTVAQAFALAMSIRLTQIFWNLTGIVVVLRGDFHAPTAREQQQVELENVDEVPEPESRKPVIIVPNEQPG